METKVNYALVGAFVLILSIALVATILWIASGGSQRKDYDTFLAYFTESVSGLNPKAPVKYRGVDVGFVAKIELDSENPDQVRVELSIERGVPIRRDTTATLSTQGLTGIAFVDLFGGSPTSPLLTAGDHGEEAVIATRPSLFRRLDAQTTSLVSNLSETARSVNALMNAETRTAMQQTIRDLDVVVHALAEHTPTLVADASQTLSNGPEATAAMKAAMEEIAQSAKTFERASLETQRAASAVVEMTEGAAGGVEQLRDEILPELRELVLDSRVVMGSLARLARDLEQDPNALVIGREPTPPGPGE